MNGILISCNKFVEKYIVNKCCGGRGKAEEKKKPTINVTQALQMNQEEQGEAREKELPATKPPEIIKKQLESILDELEQQEGDVVEYLDIIERRQRKQLNLNRLLKGQPVVQTNDGSDEEEDEEEKNNFFLKHFQNINKEKIEKNKNKHEKQQEELRIENVDVIDCRENKFGFLQELLSKKAKRNDNLPDRTFNSNILVDDPQIKDVLSFTAIQVINNKQCEPDPYESTQASDTFLHDATEWIKDIDLVYIIQSISESEHLQEEITRKKKEEEELLKKRKKEENLLKRKATWKKKSMMSQQSLSHLDSNQNIGQSSLNDTELGQSSKITEDNNNQQGQKDGNAVDDDDQFFDDDDDKNWIDFATESLDAKQMEVEKKQEEQKQLLAKVVKLEMELEEQKHKMSRQKERTGVVRRIVWFGKSRFKSQRFQIEITWVDGAIPEVVNFFEQDFKYQKKIREKFSMIQGLSFLKVIHRAFYAQQIFFANPLYITVEVKESGEHTLKDIIQQRNELDEHYSDMEIVYVIQIINNALIEAKKLNIYHSNINDENIFFFKEMKQPLPIPNFEYVYEAINRNYEMIPVSEVGNIKIAIINKIDAIKKELEQGSLDVQKTDVYSLGIVAIKMMIKNKFARLYKQKSKTPKEKFQRIFKEISKFRPYNKLIPMIKRMIAFNPEKRLNNQEIEGYIQRFKNPPQIPHDYRFFESDDEDEANSNDPNKLYLNMEGEETRIKEAIYNNFKVAQGYFDLRSFKRAGKIYKDMLNHHEILTKNLTVDRILEIQFLLGVTYFERRKLANAKIIFFDTLQLSKQFIELNQLDYRFYRSYFYLSNIAFMEREYQPALLYLEKLHDVASQELEKPHFWSKCMMYILRAKIQGDMGDNSNSILLLKQIYGQAGQWCIQNNFNTELFIEIIFRLGVQYFNMGNYGNALKTFKACLRSLRERQNQFLEQETVLMCMGYLGVIGFHMNDLKTLANYIQKSYDKILVYLRSEGDYIDTILKWLDKFSRFLPVLLANSEIKQFLDIIQIGLAKVQKTLFHDEIRIHYIIGKALYYAGDLNESMERFLQALVVYDEASEVVKDYKNQGLVSNYKIRQQVIFAALDAKKLTKKKMKALQEQGVFKFYQFGIPQFNKQVLDKILIGNIYDWLCFLFLRQQKKKQSIDCLVQYQDIMRIEQKKDDFIKIQLALRLGKIYFQFEEYAMSMETLSQGLMLLDKKPKYELSYQMKKNYQEILFLSGLIALIARCDEEGLSKFREGLKVFNISGKIEESSTNTGGISPTKNSGSTKKRFKQKQKAAIYNKIKVKHEDEVEDVDIINQKLEKDEKHNEDLFHDEVNEEANDDEENEDEENPSDSFSSEGSVLSGDYEQVQQIQLETDGQPNDLVPKQDKELLNYTLELEGEDMGIGIEESSPEHILINSYINITLNCLYIGMYDKALEFLNEGYQLLFHSQNTKKKPNVLSEIDFRFLNGYIKTLVRREWDALHQFQDCLFMSQQIYEKNIVNKPAKFRYAIISQYVASQQCKLGLYQDAYHIIETSLFILHKDIEIVLAHLTSICLKLHKISLADSSITKARKIKTLNFINKLVFDCKAAEVKLKYSQEEAVKLYFLIVTKFVEKFSSLDNYIKALVFKSICYLVLEIDEQQIPISRIGIFSRCLHFSMKFYAFQDNREGMIDCVILFADMLFNTQQFERCIKFLKQIYNVNTYLSIKSRIEKLKTSQKDYSNIQEDNDSDLFSQNLLQQADVIRIFSKCNYHVNQEYFRELEPIKDQLLLCKDIYDLCLFSTAEIPHIKIHETNLYLHIVELQLNELPLQQLKLIDTELTKISQFLQGYLKTYYFNFDDYLFSQMALARSKLCYSSFFRSYTLFQRFLHYRLHTTVEKPYFNSELKRKVRNFIENEKKTEYLDFMTLFFQHLDTKKTTNEQQKEFISVLFGESKYTTQFKSYADLFAQLLGIQQHNSMIQGTSQTQIQQNTSFGSQNSLKRQQSIMTQSQTQLNKPKLVLQVAGEKGYIDKQKDFIDITENIIQHWIQGVTQTEHPFKKELQSLNQFIDNFKEYFNE